VTERSKAARPVDVTALVDKNIAFEVKTAESLDERASRLRREEAEAEHTLRTQASEDAHARRITLIVHIFVMAVVAVAFLASVYIVVAKDPKTGLPDKAMGIITAIVAAAVGYMTGKGSK
jgi:hypothetical protein